MSTSIADKKHLNEDFLRPFEPIEDVIAKCASRLPKFDDCRSGKIQDSTRAGTFREYVKFKAPTFARTITNITAITVIAASMIGSARLGLGANNLILSRLGVSPLITSTPLFDSAAAASVLVLSMILGGVLGLAVTDFLPFGDYRVPLSV